MPNKIQNSAFKRECEWQRNEERETVLNGRL